MSRPSSPLLTRRTLLRGTALLAATSFVTIPATAQWYDAMLLADTHVVFWVTNYGRGPFYFAPHDDENTGVTALESVLPETGGIFLQLRYGGTRNIGFRLNGTRYVCDPNRIFTDTGIRQTLRQLGDTYSEEAHQAVRTLRNAILGQISTRRPRSGLVVALHNNTNNNYSIESYLPGGQEAADAGRVNRNPAIDRDDFFFTTVGGLYDALAAQGANVVEQSANVADDGSLSVYCAQAGIPYVNVEAEDGHISQQIALLRLLAAVMR